MIQLAPCAALLGALTFQDPAATPRPDASAPAKSTAPRGLVARTDAAAAGYVLIAPLRSTTTFLVDKTTGDVVHTWKSAHPPGNTVELLPDGSILRACRIENSSFHAGGIGGRLQRIAWDGTVTWDYLLSDAARIQHHDARVMPNGNVLTLVWDDMAPSDAIAAGRDPEQVPLSGMRPDSVVELKPLPPDGAQLVWEWRARDHLVQDFDATKANHGDVAARPERIDVNGDHRRQAPLTEAQRKRREETERRMRATGYAGGGDEPAHDDAGAGDAKTGDAKGDDAKADDRPRGPGRDGDWLHTNGLHWLASHDVIALSVRHMDEVWVIDHSTTTEEARGSTGGRWKRGGDLLARWGNPKMHGAGTSADRKLYRQHDATWVGVEAGGLALLVFNNGEGRPDGDYSSVDEVLLPFDAERGFGPTSKVAARWTYTAPEKTSFYSSFISGAQRLANGNTLVCSGVDGRVFEVARDGRIVWEYLNPLGGDVAAGPPGGRRPGGPDGAPPAGEPRDRPADGAGSRDRPAGSPPGGRRGGLDEKALFRATHLDAAHPGLSRLAQREAR